MEARLDWKIDREHERIESWYKEQQIRLKGRSALAKRPARWAKEHQRDRLAGLEDVQNRSTLFVEKTKVSTPFLDKWTKEGGRNTKEDDERHRKLKERINRFADMDKCNLSHASQTALEGGRDTTRMEKRRMATRYDEGDDRR